MEKLLNGFDAVKRINRNDEESSIKEISSFWQILNGKAISEELQQIVNYNRKCNIKDCAIALCVHFCYFITILVGSG